MLYLHDGKWNKIDNGNYNSEFVTCEELSPKRRIIVRIHGPDLAPYIGYYSSTELNVIDITLENIRCTSESIEAFILALAIMLQEDHYCNGSWDYSDELNMKVERLRIEYLQPIFYRIKKEDSYVSSS